MLKHGILGLLNYGDMSGYEICEVFKDSLSYFWTAQISQIYREIGAMEKNGWIEKRVVEQVSRMESQTKISVLSQIKDGRSYCDGCRNLM